jgi:hypothetical protein
MKQLVVAQRHRVGEALRHSVRGGRVNKRIALAGTLALWMAGPVTAQALIFVSGPNYEGAIMPAGDVGVKWKTFPDAMPVGTPIAWVPAAQDIEVTERELALFVARVAVDPAQFVDLIPESERRWTIRGAKDMPRLLKDLKRHYYGFQYGEVRMVLIQFMNDDPQHMWRTGAVTFSDGGCSHSHFQFNLTARRFVGFMCGADFV